MGENLWYVEFFCIFIDLYCSYVGKCFVGICYIRLSVLIYIISKYFKFKFYLKEKIVRNFNIMRI